MQQYACSSIYTLFRYLFNMTYVAARLLANVSVNSNKAEWITFMSIHVPFHRGYLSSFMYYKFTAACATRNEYVNVFSYAGSTGDLFVVEHVYGGFQHLLNLKPIEFLHTPSGCFVFCCCLKESDFYIFVH